MKNLKMPEKRARTWAIEEKDRPLVMFWMKGLLARKARLQESYKRREQRMLDRFWRRVYRFVPGARGVNASMKVNGNGKPYIEEQLP